VFEGTWENLTTSNFNWAGASTPTKTNKVSGFAERTLMYQVV
jgi:hypothetical protein